MGRLRALVLHAQQTDATRNATTQRTVLHVAHPGECNTQQPANDGVDTLPDPAAATRQQRAELQALIDKLAAETGCFTEGDKLQALEVALRDPAGWLRYLPLLLERCAAGVH